MTLFLLIKALSHLAGYALRPTYMYIAVYKHILSGGEITSPGEHLPSQECICKEHRL